MAENSYAQLIDDFENGINVLKGETLTEYIKRMGGVDYESRADGGRVGMLSGGLLKHGIMSAIEQIKNMDEGNLFSKLDPLGKARTIKDALIDRIDGFKEIIKDLKTQGRHIDEIEDMKFEMDEAKDSLKKINEYIENQPTTRTLQADGGAIGIEVLFTDKKANGGRVNFANGGSGNWWDGLEGEAKGIYDSMTAYGASDAEIQSKLQAQNLWSPDGSGSGGGGNTGQVTGIINQNIGGGGGGGMGGLDLTFTEGAQPKSTTTGGVIGQELIPLHEKQFMESFRTEKAPGVPYNKADYPYLGPKQTFTSPGVSSDGVTLYDAYTGGVKPITGRRDYRTPRTIGDQVYAASEIGELGSIPPRKEGILSKAGDMWDSTKDFFSGLGKPRVRGQLGTRLANQPRLPLPGAMASWSMSPFNEASRNYNPLFEDQLNFLETQDNMIGRDSKSGLLKYGDESVLRGKNVISLMGSNNYQAALDKEVERLEGILEKNKNKWDATKIASWKAKFLEPAYLEQQTANQTFAEKQAEIEAAKAAAAAAASRAESARQYDPNVHGPNNYGLGSDGQQSYDSGQGFGINATTGGPVSNKTGRGRTDYSKGGLASMFTRRR